MNRFLAAVVTFFVVLFVQVVLLAAVETLTGTFLDPFDSRQVLFFFMLGVSIAFAALRLVMKDEPAAPVAAASEVPSPGARNPQMQPAAASPDPRATGASPAAAPAAAQRTSSRRAPEDVIAAAKRQAILFREQFPPRHDGAARSFFGGAPFAPRGFEWPRSVEGMPLHFLLQVDCAAVPAAARLGVLPSDGVLYFFLDLRWASSGGARVLHVDTSSGGWHAVAPPDDLGPVFGEEAVHSWAWVQTREQCPMLLPKWPFEPVVIEVPELPEDEDGPNQSPEAKREALERLQRAQGSEVVSTPFTMKDIVDGDTIRRPFPAYPHDWRAVQICANELVRRAERAQRYDDTGFRDVDKEAKAALVAEIRADAQRWFELAATRPAFAEVPQAERDSFWELVVRHARLSRFVLPDALTLSIECSLAESAEAAARVPAEVAARVHHRHALAVTNESRVYGTVRARMLAQGVDVQGYQEERLKTQLLLLEISSNEALGHRFGEGVYQFWITPDDLVARRFDRVELTADAY